MKIESVSGCTCDSLNIDGKETIDMNIEDVKNVIKKLLDETNDIGVIQSILIDLVEYIGDYKDLGQCDECGDYITKYTVEI